MSRRTFLAIAGACASCAAPVAPARTARISAAPRRPAANVPQGDRPLGLGPSRDASNALTVGLASGDVFRHICAFPPGFIIPGARVGRPAVFISDGTGDTVLPIRQTSRRIVPRLRAGGYRVTYREFDGGHAVPVEMIPDALGALTKGP